MSTGSIYHAGRSDVDPSTLSLALFACRPRPHRRSMTADGTRRPYHRPVLYITVGHWTGQFVTSKQCMTVYALIYARLLMPVYARIYARLYALPLYSSQFNAILNIVLVKFGNSLAKIYRFVIDLNKILFLLICFDNLLFSLFILPGFIIYGYSQF